MGILKPQHLACNPIAYETIRENAWIVLNQLDDSKQFSDLLITCRDEQYSVHRCILAAVSPYFKTLLLGDFPLEKIGDSVKTDLSNFSPSCVQLFLALIYQKPRFDASEVDHLELLKLLDFLQIHTFDDVIIDAIREDIDIDNCWTFIDCAAALGIEKLSNLAIIFIVCNAQECFQSKSFTQSSADAVVACIQSDICRSLSSDVIVDSIIRWTNLDKKSRKQSCHKMIKQLCRYWTVTDTELVKLTAVVPDFKLPLKRKSNKRVRDDYSVIMHYSHNDDGLEHCFYDVDEHDDNCKENCEDCQDLEPLQTLVNFKFTQDEFNTKKSESRALCFWQSTLYIAVIQSYENNEDYYEDLLISKYNQTYKTLEVIKKIFLDGMETENYLDSDSDSSLDSQHNKMWANVAGMHCYQGILYIVLQLHATTKMHACLLIKVNTVDYKEVGDRVKLDLKRDSGSLQFQAEGKDIYLVSAHDLYHIDAGSEDKVKRYQGITYGNPFQVALYNGSLYGVDTIALTEKSLVFYRFDCDFWYRLFSIDFSTETLDSTFHEFSDKAHLFSHGSVLYINLPIFPRQKNSYRKVLIESEELDDTIFRLGMVYSISRYISLPKTFLL